MYFVDTFFLTETYKCLILNFLIVGAIVINFPKRACGKLGGKLVCNEISGRLEKLKFLIIRFSEEGEPFTTSFTM